MRRPVGLGTCFFVGLTGCNAEQSEPASSSTSEIYPVFTVEAHEDGATARASFRIGDADSDTYLELNENDILYVETQDSDTVLTLEEGTQFTYVAEIPTNEGGAWFNFVFERAEYEAAPYNTVVLPQSIDIHRPYLDEEFSRNGDDLEVVYSPSSPTMDVTGPMDLALQGACVEPIERQNLVGRMR